MPDATNTLRVAGTTILLEAEPRGFDSQLRNLLALDAGRAGPLRVVVLSASALDRDGASATVPGWTFVEGGGVDSWTRVLSEVETEFVCIVRGGIRLRWDALDVLARDLLASPGTTGATGDSFLTDRAGQDFAGHIRCGLLHRPAVAGRSLVERAGWEAPALFRTESVQGFVFEAGAEPVLAQAVVQRAASLGEVRARREFLFLEAFGPGFGPDRDGSDPRRAVLAALGSEVPPSTLRDDGGIDLYVHDAEGPEGRWVNVLTVTFNRLEYTRKTIEGLVETMAFPHGILVVDNASVDGSREYLLEQYRNGVVRKILLLDRNVGLARGINIGWRHETGSDFLLKLDNDMVFQRRGWLENVVEASDKVPEAAVLGFNVEPRSYPATVHNGVSLRVKADANVGGGCVFLSNRTRDLFGYFCEDYGLYGEEDGDLGLRVRLEGFLNAYMDDEDIAFHLPSGKAGAIDPRTLKAIDPMEMEIDPEYRRWKDEQRAHLQKNGGILQRNIVAYHSGQRSRWVPTGEFMGLLGDLQVFDDVDRWSFAFHPRDGRVVGAHEEAVAAWAASQGLPVRPVRSGGHGREWIELAKNDPPFEGIPGVVVGPGGVTFASPPAPSPAGTPRLSRAGEVSIIIPVHGHLDLTKQCLDAVRATTDAATTEIVVVDDASPDDSAAWLRSEDAAGRLKAVILPANKGFAGACNAGAAASSGRVLLFLNNDTIARPGWLGAMLDALRDPAVGLVGSRLLYPEGDIQHAGMRMMPNGLPDHEFRHAPGDDPRVLVSRDRAFVTGACIALSRDLYATIGGFDEGYHMYVEDLDLCMKVWNEGLRVRYVAESVVVHLEARTTPDHDRRTAQVKEGMERLMGRWMGRWPEGLLALADWPAHFRPGPSLRWSARMLADEPEASLHRSIAVFLEPLLPSFQVDPGKPDAAFMATLRRDPDATATWTRLLSRPHDEAVSVFAPSATASWIDAGRPSGHVAFVRSAAECADPEFLACVRSAGTIWACGRESVLALRPIAPGGEIVALPAVDDKTFAMALLDACARLMERATRTAAPQVAPPLHWMAPTLNFTGYARLNREAFLALDAAGTVRVSHDTTMASEEFVGSLKSEGSVAVERWNRALQAVPDPSGLCLISDLACNFEKVRALRGPFARYAGLTMFETDRLPEGWKDACLGMDEIWVPSTFNMESFARAGVPEAMLHRIPCGIDMERYRPGSQAAMAVQGRRRFNFLSVFEWTLRKGWDSLLLAWARAFTKDDQVSLTIKTSLPGGVEGARRVVDGFYASQGIDPRRLAPVIVIEGFLPESIMPSLYAAADAFVLPTRGEGWGLPFLEAMASGMPVIATGWSAHTDFVDDRNGYLVDHVLVPVAADQTKLSSLYGPDHLWAEPAVEHLVELMVRCAKHPREVRERGNRARRDVESDWSSRRTAAWIAERAAARSTTIAARSGSPSAAAAPGRVRATGPRIGFDGRTFSIVDSVVRGIGHYAVNHLEALARERPGSDIVVVVHDTDPVVDGIRQRISSLGLRTVRWSEVDSSDFDLFHSPDPMNVQPGAVSPFQRFRSTALTATFYDVIPIRMYNGRISNWSGYLARLDEMEQRGVELLCISEFTRRDLVAATGIDASRTRTVGAGFNHSASGAAWTEARGEALLGRLGIGKPFFLHVGAVDPHKNPEAVLAVCQALSRQRPLQLVFVGKLSNSLRSLKEQVVSTGLRDVVFTDYLSREELELLYSRAVGTMFLSRYEGFGFPALEAMANGCPLICSNATSLPEVAGDAALVHDPDDLEGVARSAIALLDNPKLRQELVAKGLERARAFLWEDVARRTWSAWDEVLGKRPATRYQPPPSPARVQWISPIWDPSGYADESRAFVRHLAATDLVPSVLAVGRHSESFRNAASAAERGTIDGLMGREMEPLRPVVLDMPASGFGKVDGAGYHVGRTTFETDSLPAPWVQRCNQLDELWVPCAFNVGTFRAAGVRVPILVVPEGVDSERFRPGLPPLEIAGPARTTTFLSVFEWTHRKGPDLLFAAWARTFSKSDDVRLVVRTYPPNVVEGDPAAWVESRIDEAFAKAGRRREDCAPVVVLARQVPDADMPRLYAAADVYVAPSRGEGWGRPHMEAMSSGLPVIATRWSGNLEFQDDDNSWLVEIDGLEEIRLEEEFDFYRGQKWAKPSLDSLAARLREAADRPDLRRALGARARADIVARWDWKAIAPCAGIRLREILEGVPVEASKVPRHLADVARGTGPAAVSPTSGSTTPSVAWCGPLFNYSGYARQGREAVAALVDAGVQVGVDPQQNDPAWFAGLRGDDAALARWKAVLSAEVAGDVLVCCDLPSDAAGTHDVFAEMAQGHAGCRKVVGWTMFETDRAPKGWIQKLSRLDEVWVPSRRVQAAFAASGLDPARMRVVPEGLDPAPYADARPMPLPGPGKGTTFLSVFQWSRRKGWDVLLEAWSRAFGPTDDVRLVLRCHALGAASVRSQLDAWLAERGLSPADMAPVILLDDFVPEPEMPGLYAACDVFVLPTRGEGWGLPFLEAMASGKPCIATAWGGQTDFLHEGVAWMLPVSETVPVDAEALRENPFLSADHRWADPQVADLVEALRAAQASPEERRRRGERARAEFLGGWTAAHTARAIAAALGGLVPSRIAATRPIGNSRLSGLLAAVAEGLMRHPRPTGIRKAASETPRTEPGRVLAIRWEGSQFVHHSLAHVNRELCLGLAKAGHDLSLIPYEPDQFGPGQDPDLGILASLVDAPLEGACQVHVRHQWPPNLKAPSEGRWIVIQPWEFGSPPREWVAAWRDAVDDLWAYTDYVRDMYLRAGMPPDRVHVVPLGVDCDRFRPGLAPLGSLPAKKGVRFLYVGGTIARKGFDVLLNAWQKAFGPDDSVELLIKDMGGKTTYAGQTGEAAVRKIQESGRFATIHYRNDDLAPSELPALYASGDVLVHPYRGEGFGLPIAEAMACGLPVIATRGGAADDFCGADEAWMIPSTRSLLPNGRVGDTETVEPAWWLEPSEEALVAALREAALDAGLRASKGRMARERILGGFTWAHAVARAQDRLALVVSRPIRRRASPATEASPGLHAQATGIEADLESLSLLLLQVEGAVSRQEFAEAETLSRDAVGKHPDRPIAWLTRAMVLRAMGKNGKALEALGRAASAGGGPEVIYETMALHLQTGKTGPAQIQWKLLQEKHPVWVAQRKEIHQRAGQPWLPDRFAVHGKPTPKKASARKR